VRPGLLVPLAVLVAALAATAGTTESLTTASGVTVEMSAGSLEPGQPILFVLRSGETTGVILHFLGQKAVLKPSSVPMAILAVDLDAKPGVYPLEMQVERKDGALEGFRREFEVRGRTFPSTRLRVKQEFVTPPRSEQERIRRESEMLALVFSLITPEWLGDGPFMAPHPVKPWPNFGQRRVTNNVLSSVHSGIDLPVPYGEPIRATNRGRVVMASPLYLSGLTVVIDHGLGVFSFYCHLSKLDVRRGDLVGKGAVIGACGSTGRSTGPHLHWSMRVGDGRVDPYAMLGLPIAAGPGAGAEK
jgi:Peptidase family M23